MIEDIKQWVKNLIFLVLFASFLEMLLPSSNMRKFVRVLVGLCVMSAALEPLMAVYERRLPPPSIAVTAANTNLQQQDWKRNKLDVTADNVFQRELARRLRAGIESLPGVAGADVTVLIDRANDDLVDKVIVAVKPSEQTDRRLAAAIAPNEVKNSAETVLNEELRHKIWYMVTTLYQIDGAKLEIRSE